MSEYSPELENIAIKTTEKVVETVIIKIDERIRNQPTNSSTESTAQLSTSGKLKEVTKKFGKDQINILWSNLKAIGVGAVSLIPILGGSVEAASAGMADVAALEGLSKAEAEMLAKGGVISESGKIIQPLEKILGKAGAEKAVKVFKSLDPFPDVPTGFVVTAGAAEAAGLEGAGLAPVVWQLAVNQIETTKNNFGYAIQVGEILINSPEAQKIKDHISNVTNNIKERLNNAQTPKMAAAAAAFA